MNLIDFILVLDGLGTSISGVLWYLFPAWFLGLQTTAKTDSIGLHMSSSFGAMVAASGVIPFALLTIDSPGATAAFFAMRIVGCSLICIAQLRAQLAPGSLWGNGHWAIGIGMNATWGLMDLAGLVLVTVD